MGNLYRFVEPVLLYLLKEKGSSYGYALLGAAASCAMTGSDIDSASLYRTLRQLEAAGMVASEWDSGPSGPARRRYRLTPAGEDRLAAWAEVLQHLSASMSRFVAAIHDLR